MTPIACGCKINYQPSYSTDKCRESVAAETYPNAYSYMHMHMHMT